MIHNEIPILSLGKSPSLLSLAYSEINAN